MNKDSDQTALRININRILEMFLKGDIDPPDAVADLKKFCHPEFTSIDGRGLDAHLAKTLALVSVNEIDTDWALTHLLRLATTKTLYADQLYVFG